MLTRTWNDRSSGRQIKIFKLSFESNILDMNFRKTLEHVHKETCTRIFFMVELFEIKKKNREKKTKIPIKRNMDQ